jgi:GNAT superfamily N-acetyltransferase
MTTPGTTTPPKIHQTWTRDGFLLSTDPSLIDIAALTSAFDQPFLYWAKPLPAEAMKTMVENSLCFGLYTPTPEAAPTLAADDDVPSTSSSTTTTHQIGVARLITDYTTFAYLTDVYVLPPWQGSGLGKWLIDCVQGWLEGLPYLRRSMLVTGRDGPGRGFYERRMRMSAVGEGEEKGGDLVSLSWVGPGWPGV